MKVLLVDDEPVLRELFAELLTRKGYEVETAKDGVEGVSKFRHGDFDRVLTDYQMPRMNGVLMIEEIQKLSPEVRIVMMSADPPNRFPAGIKVLRKPFGNADLLEALA